jgi:hypothetical protein
MTVLRSGSTQQYSANWSSAFGERKRAFSKAEGEQRSAEVDKPDKKSAAKKIAAKKSETKSKRKGLAGKNVTAKKKSAPEK